MELNIVKKYCAKYGLNYNDLTSEARNRIVKNAYKYLEQTFKDRRESDPEIKKLEAQQILFINEMKKAGMLSHTYNKSYFGMDKKGAKFSLGDRLTRLYRIRDTVISLIDEDKRKEISEEFIVKAMDQWIYWHSQGQPEEFFKYLRQMEYVKEPYKYNPSYAWFHIKTLTLEGPYVKGRTQSVSDGETSYTDNHAKSGDVFSATTSWTQPKTKYKAGEVVKLTLTANITDYQWYDEEAPYFHPGLNYMNALITVWFDDPDVDVFGRSYQAIRFKDKDGRQTLRVRTDYGKIVVESDNGVFTAKFPKSYEEGEKLGIHVVSTPAGKVVYVYEWRKE